MKSQINLRKFFKSFSEPGSEAGLFVLKIAGPLLCLVAVTVNDVITFEKWGIS